MSRDAVREAAVRVSAALAELNVELFRFAMALAAAQNPERADPQDPRTWAFTEPLDDETSAALAALRIKLGGSHVR